MCVYVCVCVACPTLCSSDSAPVIPLPGKVSSRVGVPSEDDNVVMSPSQQLGKPYKISQVTVVTKPAATVSSAAAAASHVSHMVRTLV